MVGLPRGASSGPFAHVCALLIASGQNSRRTEPSLGFRPTSLGFLHREPRGGPALPRGPSPPRVCASHARLEGSSRSPVPVQPRGTCSRDPSSPPSKLAGGCSKGGLSPERGALTKDPFLQTGSFDTFTESAALLTCGRGHVTPQSLIYRRILKLLYISFSVLHTWLQSVEILSVCTVAWDHAPPDSSCITPPLQCPLCVTLSSCDPRHCPRPPCPSPQHAGPRALTRGSHDSRAICMRLALHAPLPRALTLPVTLSTAARKENCLPLKMPVKTWGRAPRRLRRSLRPPGPPAVVQSRGKARRLGSTPALPSAGRCLRAWVGGAEAGGVITAVLRRSVTHSAQSESLESG